MNTRPEKIVKQANKPSFVSLKKKSGDGYSTHFGIYISAKIMRFWRDPAACFQQTADRTLAADPRIFLLHPITFVSDLAGTGSRDAKGKNPLAKQN